MSNPEPNIRYAASTMRSSSTGDSEYLQGKPVVRPAVQKFKTSSTTGTPNGNLTNHPHRQSPAYQTAAQSTSFRHQYKFISSEQSTVPNVQPNAQPQGSPGNDLTNGPSGISSEPLNALSTTVTTTNAQGSQIVYTVPEAVITLPVTTADNEGKPVFTESLLTAAATAYLDAVITSIDAAGNTMLQTSRVPAVVYTTTNSQGATVVIKSAVFPATSAPEPKYQQKYQSGEASDAQPAPGGQPKPEAGQSNPAAQNTPGTQPGYNNAQASNKQQESNAGAGGQASQPNASQNSNDAGIQNQQSNSQPQSGSSSSTKAISPSLDYSSAASSYYRSSELKVDSTYDRLASGGLAALAGNASATAQFVQDTLANQTDAQKQALKTDLNAQFMKFIDGLFTDTSPGQPGSQTLPGFQSPQDLASQSCSDLGEIHGQLITDFFFMQTTISTIFEYYQSVRNVFIGQCQ